VLRKMVAVSILLITVMGASINVWSHGGRINSEGCHNDSKAGTYHCHRSNTTSKASSSVESVSYNRDNWKFRSSASPVSSAVLGWYTGVNGSATDVDHVVALKDAYLSGGKSWSIGQKKDFANDAFNHVSAVPYVNRTLKNAYLPLKFITKVNKSRYTFASGKCEAYVDLYVQVKRKYQLNFKHNKIDAAKAACR
jgi:hypothetical protein